MLPREPRNWLTRNEELAQKTDWESNQELLRVSVQCAVPLHIVDLKAKGGPSDFQWEWAQAFAGELGAKGDILQFRGCRKGETATMFNRFAYALAIMAFVPGGVDFAGLHFEAKEDHLSW